MTRAARQKFPSLGIFPPTIFSTTYAVLGNKKRECAVLRKWCKAVANLREGRQAAEESERKPGVNRSSASASCRNFLSHITNTSAVVRESRLKCKLRGRKDWRLRRRFQAIGDFWAWKNPRRDHPSWRATDSALQSAEAASCSSCLETAAPTHLRATRSVRA